MQAAKQGKDLGDHPPITPTVNVPHHLGGDHLRVYDYVARHFLGTISADAKYKRTTVSLRLANTLFKA